MFSIKTHLGPLALAANILQSSSTHLEHIPLVFAMLYHHFHTLLTAERADEDEKNASTTVISSAEKRWKAADQDIFLAAIILHPGLKLCPLNPEIFSYADIYMLFTHVYLCLFPDTITAPSALKEDVKAYLDNTGRFKGLAHLYITRLDHAEKNNTSPVSKLLLISIEVLIQNAAQ